MKLTEAQRTVLRVLSRLGEWDCPPTGPELSINLGHVPYWASGKLSSLMDRRLVERLGQSSTGGYCWRITPAGRSILDGGREK